MKIHCPAYIEFLLHCYTSGKRFERIDAPVYQEAIKTFLQAGVIVCEGVDCYRTTPLGDAWVRALENVELPRSAFVDSQGNVL